MESDIQMKNTNNINTHETHELEDLPQLKNENIEIDIVTEGKATVRLSNDDKSFSAFYNPAQEFNRDLSVAAINTFFTFHKFRKQKEITQCELNKFSVCECLSATGLRAIRYHQELESEKVKEIIANDMDKKAVDCIHNNVLKNNISDTKFKVYQYECTQLLYSHMKQFDVIDLDPYGSAIPMIDSAIQSVKNNGLLCVTFTDMPVLCGNYPETTYYKYNSIPYKTSFCHEMAKRIALYSISSSASKYKKVIKPLISFNAEFYIRLFLIVKDSPEDCKSNCMKYGYLYHCRNCQNRYITPLATINSTKNAKTQKISKEIKFNNLTGNSLCDVCDSNMCMSGPYWIDNLHDEDFINNVLIQLNEENSKFSYLKYKKRITTFLNGILEEMPLSSQIFNLDYSQFSRDAQVSCPKLSLVKGALESLNYKIIQSYYDPNLFKSDAPVSVIYDVFKKYKKDNYSDDYYKNVKEDSYKYKLLQKEIKVDPIFVNSVEINEKSSGNKGKYLPNPLPNWGPKARAKEKKPVDANVTTDKK